MNKKIHIIVILSFIFLINNFLYANTPEDFNLWLENFKEKAVSKGISKKTVNLTMQNVKFLPKVIEYDRYQPEFYEDTYTYIKKRTNKDKVKKGLFLYKNEKNLINNIEKKFLVEKELLLALMVFRFLIQLYRNRVDFFSIQSFLYNLRQMQKNLPFF